MRFPHGPATVSGERAPFVHSVCSPYLFALHHGMLVRHCALQQGRRGRCATIRKSGDLPPGPSLPPRCRRRTTGAVHAGGVDMVSCRSPSCCRSRQLRSLRQTASIRRADVQRRPSAIRGHVDDPAAARSPGPPSSSTARLARRVGAHRRRGPLRGAADSCRRALHGRASAPTGSWPNRTLCRCRRNATVTCRLHARAGERRGWWSSAAQVPRPLHESPTAAR